MLRPRSLLCALLSATLLASVACGRIFEYPEPVDETGEARCHDGEDNDLDDAIDCGDPNCAEACDETSEARCSDEFDNDADGFVDCRDSDCSAACPEGSQETCSDDFDNDADGRTDCEDTGCDGLCPETSAGDCDDQRDNDGDSLLDARDPSCWPLFPPEVERCAASPGVEIRETFDGWPWGDAWFVTDAFYPGVRFYGTRTDPYLQCSFPDEPTQAESCVLVRNWPFAGTWSGLELSFGAFVSLGTSFSVGFVPIDLAPDRDVPLTGADGALLSIVLDSEVGPPTLSVDFQGRRASIALPELASGCPDWEQCDEVLSSFRLTIDQSELRLSFEPAEGDAAELVVPVEAPRRLPPVRLVVWANDARENTLAGLDDLHLTVPPEYPCGFPVPQISPGGCEPAAGTSYRTVSLARGADATYCALLTGSETADSKGTVAAFRSLTGETWSPEEGVADAGPDFAEDSTPVGSSLVHDGERFRAAILYRSDDATRVGFTSSKDCNDWSNVVAGPELDDAAEAPSLVFDDGRYELYFSRPALEGTRRTLWRSSSKAPEGPFSEPIELTELDSEVGGRVTVQRVGLSDRVLIYPLSNASGRGLGLSVADSDGTSWTPAGTLPWVAAPPHEVTGGEPLAFDDREIRSAALAWESDATSDGFLLYAGVSDAKSGPIASVGTARVRPAGVEPAGGSVAGPSCGDGACNGGESCDSCPRDCDCAAIEVLESPFLRSERWASVAEEGLVSVDSRVDETAEWLSFSTLQNQALVLPLERSMSSDFELSFDLWVGWYEPYHELDVPAGLNVSVGLGPLATSSNADGIYARMTFAWPQARLSGAVPPLCPGKYVVEPLVALDGNQTLVRPKVLPGEPCSGSAYGTVERRERVILRRQGSQVSTSIARDGGCVEQSQIDLPATVAPMTALVVTVQGSLMESAVAGTISDLRLRLLDDPADCPVGMERCGGGEEETACVDTTRSFEHCGECGRRCERGVCEAGRCECAEWYANCGGACVDLAIDSANCGECGHTCESGCAPKTCWAGACSAPTLPDGLSAELASRAAVEADLCGTAFENTLIFQYRATATGTVTFTQVLTDGASPGRLAVTETGDCGPWDTCSDDSIFSIPATGGTTYYVAIAVADTERVFLHASLRPAPSRQ